MYLGDKDPRNIVPLQMDSADGRYNCLMAGTPIVLADYSTMSIEDIVRQRLAVDVLAWSHERGMHSAPVYDWHKQRVPGQEWIRIQLERLPRNHRGLVVTPDHEVYLENGTREVAANLQVGQALLLPEARLNDALTDAVCGTLLGDTRLVVSPAYRRNWHAAYGAALDGGHVESTGLAQYKTQVFAGCATLGILHPETTREIKGALTNVQAFRPWRTHNLYGLQSLLREFYTIDGVRTDPFNVVARLGVLGWAWWFMDDGCVQKTAQQDGMTIALSRYSDVFALAVRDIARQRWGSTIYVGADRILRFSNASAVAFAADIAPHVLPALRYKLPRGLTLPDFTPLNTPPLRTPVCTRIASVIRYAPKTRTPGERLKAETRFCISVEGAGNFFTSFGLVKNCRDVVGMCRAYAQLSTAVEQTNTVPVYALDRQLARIALQMKRAGLPVDMDERIRVRSVLVGLRDQALERLMTYTQGEHFNAFVDWVALFTATKPRKDEPAAGTLDNAGLPMSAEGALLIRKEIRKTEFLANLEKGALRQAVWEWIKYYSFTKETCTADTLALLLNAAKPQVASILRTYTTRKFCVTDAAGNVRPAPLVDEDAVADVAGGINLGAKIQQAAVMRVAGIPLLKVTEKTGLPKIDKEILEEFGYHAAARDLLAYTLTSSAVNNFIDGIEPVEVVLASDGRHYGVIHPDWMIHKITGRWGSSPNCFDPETELLTREGWMLFPDFLARTTPVEVAQFWKDTGAIDFTLPDARQEYDFDGELFHFTNDRLSLCVTGDHRIPLLYDGTTEIVDVLAADLHACAAAIPGVPAGVAGVAAQDSIKLDNVQIARVAHTGKVYCVSVPSTYIVVRRHGETCIAAQCQNWSKRAGGGVENIRQMIAAPPGEIFIGADYAQLEARLLAAMSQDAFLMDIFNNNRDIHSEFAKLAFPKEFPSLAAVFVEHKKSKIPCGPDPTDPKSKCKDCKRRDKLRDLTKRLEYGGFYGGTVETLWTSVVKDVPDLELSTVRNFLIEVNKTCVGLRRFQAQMQDYVLRAGEIRSPVLGRRQVFPMQRVDPTVVMNFPNQSGGSDFWGIGATKFAARYDQTVPVGQGPRLIHNGHDSVLVRAPEAQAQEVKAAVEECWTHNWNGVNFLIEADIGRRWSDT